MTYKRAIKQPTANCPIRERTADGIAVGRCWYYLPDGKRCPRHGDVSAAVEVFNATGRLSDEREYCISSLPPVIKRGGKVTIDRLRESLEKK